MKQLTTQGIVLSRTDFGEADRIITFLTPDHGKVKVIAKGVRKSKAKLAGSVEPFGVSDLSVIVGRGEINTLTSARLIRHYGIIVKNLDRTSAGFEAMKILDRATQEKTEEAYFNLLDRSLAAIDDLQIDLGLSVLWFKMQLLKISGHSPNLHSDGAGRELQKAKSYDFDFDKMRFVPKEQGQFFADHIKFLRLGFSANSPKALQRIENVQKLVKDCQSLIDTILKTYIHI